MTERRKSAIVNGVKWSEEEYGTPLIRERANWCEALKARVPEGRFGSDAPVLVNGVVRNGDATLRQAEYNHKVVPRLSPLSGAKAVF